MDWSLFGRKKHKSAEAWNPKTMFGPNLNFAATEAYKLLRTNIVFSFSDEGAGRAIGVTNLLISRGDYKEALQHCELAPKLDVLVSGDIPPNPSELLASNRMTRLMDQLKQDYNYIVVDLPPVTVVSDALAISKNLDGAVMVVRGGVSDQQMLAEALRQLELVNVPVLGFVYRENDASGKKYGSRYGKKYYKYYKAYEKKK